MSYGAYSDALGKGRSPIQEVLQEGRDAGRSRPLYRMSLLLSLLQDGERCSARQFSDAGALFRAARSVGLPLSDGNASPIGTYHQVPEHVDLAEDRYIFSTFKWNVHTQGRSGHWKYAAEIIHTNPVFMHRETGKTLGVKEGNSVEISVFRPTGHTYRSGEEGVMGSFKNHVRFLKGMHPRVVMCSHHVGHWEHGIVGSAASKETSPAEGKSKKLSDSELQRSPWWSKQRGGIGGGVHINDALPINPAPLIGGQNWYDNVCKIERLTS
jgi:anaerobic selenocysteine-containing dehydrogenase